MNFNKMCNHIAFSSKSEQTKNYLFEPLFNVCFFLKICSSVSNECYYSMYLGTGKKGGKPVVPQTHLKIKWFFGCMSVTDQQKSNNAAHFIFPIKVINQVTIQKMHSSLSAVPFLQGLGG